MCIYQDNISIQADIPSAQTRNISVLQQQKKNLRLAQCFIFRTIEYFKILVVSDYSSKSPCFVKGTDFFENILKWGWDWKTYIFQEGN
tara:strand:+ start:75 stop:338 length:264 start_codon:yes stop_codon:yes gene_type:complete